MHIAIATLCPMSLSARLIQLRRERDWTQQDVAEQVGLHVNQIKRYEAGSAQPSLEGLKKIAKAFSVSTDWLLFEDAERGPDEDLRLQFEAMNQLSSDEKAVARAVLEGLLLKHVAHKWSAPGMAQRAEQARLAAQPAAQPATLPSTGAPATSAKSAASPVVKRAAKAAPTTPTKRAVQAAAR